ncbi:MBL fold metallo-hydrolase [Streptomyces sp. NPDC001848]|uniref:MBL fold metallo-hydrolase n=1 Tax=Streptomyces sp. NPDC001848 TaxID=3364618 RepID=UPI0036CE4A98
MTSLAYAVHVSPMQPLAPTALPPRPDGGPLLWSPLSTTLIYGPREAVLVDPGLTTEQGLAVAKWAAGFDRTITGVYVTHAHGDHWYATAPVRERFPDLTVWATADTIAEMERTTPGGLPNPFWGAAFPGLIGDTPVIAEAVPEGGLQVDGQPLVPHAAGHTDTEHTTFLHVPSLDLVVSGDVIYNQVHQYLAEAGAHGIDSWLSAIDAVAAVNPTTVVAGHKNPERDDSASIIEDTRDYLRAAAEVFGGATSRGEYFEAMTQRFPAWLNPGIAWLTAVGRWAE